MAPTNPLPDDALLNANMIGGYRVVETIATGTACTVHVVQDPEGRRYALKQLKRSSSRKPRHRLRFGNECAILRATQHPRFPKFVEEGEDDLGPYLVMEYVEGPLLEEVRLTGLPMHGARLASALADVAEGLACLHGRGLVHRDIKPENIILTRARGSVILDLGIAKPFDSAPPELSSVPLAGPTLQGYVVGTAEYMSPEQATGKPLSAATDLFSLGLVLYELGLGQHPFTGSSSEILRSIASRHVKPPADSEHELAHEPILMKLLAYKPELRPTAQEAASELRRIAAGER